MSDDWMNQELTDFDREMLESSGISVHVETEGLLVSGDDDAVAGYLSRIKDLVGDGVQVAGIDKTAVANAGGLIAGAAAAKMQHGHFVRLAPQSVDMLKSYKVIPGIPGYNRMTLVDSAHKFRHQMQWQPVAMTPTRALGMQLMVVQLALQTAISEVSDGIKRIEGEVDKILHLAQAAQVGDVVGHHSALSSIIKVHKETGALPTTDWESVASLGPQLQVGIERLRDHAKRTVNSFDADKPVQERAAYLTRAVKDERLGETLQLLVIAERSLYLWQTLRIARVRAVEPEHLDAVVASAREMLAEHVERDGDLLRHARLELSNYGTVKPLEIVRWMATGDLKRDITQLRNDLDAFASARNSQVTGWIDNEDPSISDAFAELGSRAKAVGGAAAEIGGKAVSIGAAGAGWIGRSVRNAVGSKGDTPETDAKQHLE